MTPTTRQSITSFRSSRGNQVDVFSEKAVGSNGTFRGFGRTTRTWAEVCGRTIEVEPGCAFQAASVVSAAGF